MKRYRVGSIWLLAHVQRGHAREFSKGLDIQLEISANRIQYSALLRAIVTLWMHMKFGANSIWPSSV